MNTSKLYALAYAFEAIGLTAEQAFEKAFNEYSAIKCAQKEADLVTAAGVSCCALEGSAA